MVVAAHPGAASPPVEEDTAERNLCVAPNPEEQSSKAEALRWKNYTNIQQLTFLPFAGIIWDSDPCQCRADVTCGMGKALWGSDACHGTPTSKGQCQNLDTDSKGNWVDNGVGCVVPAQNRVNFDGAYGAAVVGGTDPQDDTAVSYDGTEALDFWLAGPCISSDGLTAGSSCRDAKSFGEGGNPTNPLITGTCTNADDCRANCPTTLPRGDDQTYQRWLACTKTFSKVDHIDIPAVYNDDNLLSFNGVAYSDQQYCTSDYFYVGPNAGGTNGCPAYSKKTVTVQPTKGQPVWEGWLNPDGTVKGGANTYIADYPSDKLFQGITTKWFCIGTECTTPNTTNTSLMSVPNGSSHQQGLYAWYEGARMMIRRDDPNHPSRFILYLADFEIDGAFGPGTGQGSRNDPQRVVAAGHRCTTVADIITYSAWTLQQCIDNYTPPGCEAGYTAPCPHHETGSYVDPKAVTRCYLVAAEGDYVHQPIQ
jgi:hypothetical protein